jgi:inhibitor of cysteine peptidase
MNRRPRGYALLLWLAAALSIGAMGAVQGQERVVTISESQNGSTATIAKNQSLSILLSAQSGTGYSWALAGNPTAPLELVRSATVSAAEQPGGTQTQGFLMRPTNVGAGDVVINYSRPWEKDKPPARTFTLHVVVR